MGRKYGHVTLLPKPGQIEEDLEGLVLRGAPEGHVQVGLGPRLDGARRGWAVVDMKMGKWRGCFTPYIILIVLLGCVCVCVRERGCVPGGGRRYGNGKTKKAIYKLIIGFFFGRWGGAGCVREHCGLPTNNEGGGCHGGT